MTVIINQCLLKCFVLSHQEFHSVLFDDTLIMKLKCMLYLYLARIWKWQLCSMAVNPRECNRTYSPQYNIYSQVFSYIKLLCFAVFFLQEKYMIKVIALKNPLFLERSRRVKILVTLFLLVWMLCFCLYLNFKS